MSKSTCPSITCLLSWRLGSILRVVWGAVVVAVAVAVAVARRRRILRSYAMGSLLRL